MEQQTGLKEVFLRVVAIVGLIAVLILGAWGIILLAFNLVGLFNGSVHLSNLFNSDNGVQQAATTTAPVVVTQNNGATASSNTSTGSTKPAGSATQAGNATAVYTAAPRASQLYGYSDLKVNITSVNSLSSVQGRTVVQFTIINGGTNIANSGWSFNAALPYQNSTYTYQSAPQQALYPGDSIAYTLTYDDPSYGNYYGQPCTLQYPNNCYNNYNNNQYCTTDAYGYQYCNGYNYNYTQPATCYTYNGYANTPYPCDNGNTSGNPNYDYYNQYNYNQNYNYYGYRTVTINVDPQNFVQESAEYNNSASKSF
jgi:hypothetical protein